MNAITTYTKMGLHFDIF